jgi:uncharacterized protein
MKLSRYVVASPVISNRTDRRPRRILLSTRSSRVATVAAPTWDALTKGDTSVLEASSASALAEAGILVDDHADELGTVLEENKAAIASDAVLRHVIQPTAACQLGCDYCGQEHFALQMSIQRQDALLRRLRRQLEGGGYRDLAISWFGAEPLLGIKTMRRLSPLLCDLASDLQVGYSSTMVSNGMRLTPAIVSELEAIHRVCAVEVTLDGPEAIHDERRPAKNGSSSFARILANLVAVANDPEIGIELNIRCNVDRANADYVTELIGLLSREGLSNRVKLSFAPVYSWGNDAGAASLTPADFAEREIEWFAQMHNCGYELDLLPRRKPIVCLAVRRDGELTDARGTVFNCTEVSYVPTYGDPNRYAVGTLEHADRAQTPPFHAFNDEVAEGKHSQCASCHMLPACGGACPKQWSEGNSPCPSSKANIGQRLMLWYALARE